MNKSILSLLCLSLTSAFGAHAQTALPDLSKYQCYKVDTVGLHISQEDDIAGRGFPHVFQRPTTKSKQIGLTDGIVWVAWPLVKNNGFLQILRANGQIGWVAETTLIPMRKSDGTVGGCTLSWRQPGRIQMRLDPGVAIRN